MTVDVKLFDDLDAVERAAGPALSRQARPSLFERLDWYRLVNDHTPPDGRLVAIETRNGEAGAWLFLAKDGFSAVPFSNWYCLRFGPVVTGERPQAALGGFARGLRQAGIGRLSLSPLSAGDPLAAALRRKGWVTRLSSATVNWRLATKGMSFDDYWASRPSKLRNTVKRRARTAALDVRIHTSFDEQAWRDYESVYEASWKPAEGSPDLMRRLAKAEGAAGTLRLGLAYRDGGPVAAQLWVVENGIATIHKLAYREDARQYSPGSILSMEMFRRAIDADKVDWIDFGIGGDGYKAEWMSESVPLYRLDAYDPFSIGGLTSILRALASKLVRRLRSA